MSTAEYHSCTQYLLQGLTTFAKVHCSLSRWRRTAALRKAALVDTEVNGAQAMARWRRVSQRWLTLLSKTTSAAVATAPPAVAPSAGAGAQAQQLPWTPTRAGAGAGAGARAQLRPYNQPSVVAVRERQRPLGQRLLGRVTGYSDYWLIPLGRVTRSSLRVFTGGHRRYSGGRGRQTHSKIDTIQLPTVDCGSAEWRPFFELAR